MCLYPGISCFKGGLSGSYTCHEITSFMCTCNVLYKGTTLSCISSLHTLPGAVCSEFVLVISRILSHNLIQWLPIHLPPCAPVNPFLISFQAELHNGEKFNDRRRRGKESNDLRYKLNGSNFEKILVNNDPTIQLL